MKKDVAVIGVGQSSFVRGYEGSIRELAFEAFREAIQDAGITQKDVDASVFCSAPEYDNARLRASSQNTWVLFLSRRFMWSPSALRAAPV